MKAKCCYPTCPKNAEFTVVDTLDPDPYNNFTEACERCIGALLGHRTNTKLKQGSETWLIYPVK